MRCDDDELMRLSLFLKPRVFSQYIGFEYLLMIALRLTVLRIAMTLDYLALLALDYDWNSSFHSDWGCTWSIED